MIRRRPLLAATLLAASGTRPLRAEDAPPPVPARKVHIAQATPALAFLPLMAARAFGTFAAQGLDLFWAALPGGDPACLAALESGDVEFAAMGTVPLLAAIARGQPFQMVASIMSRLSFELVVSNHRIESAGISPADDPLATRLQVLKGATIGVGVLGGMQDIAARWLARQAGLDPHTDIKVLAFGGPVFIQGALEAGQIDAYVLSPPQGLISEQARTGQVLVRLGDEYPKVAHLPSLALAARTPIAPDTASLLVATCKALQSASEQLLADPAAGARRIQSALFPRMTPELAVAAIDRLKAGIGDKCRLGAPGIAALLDYSGIPGPPPPLLYTNQYTDEAAAG